jgi:tRNA uridine 5-carbamoylmethylation protein Kti12
MEAPCGCIVLLCGLPGAGKSTFARNAARQLNGEADTTAGGSAARLQVCVARHAAVREARAAARA